MKTVICLMFACALTAPTAYAQAPAAAQGGQKVALSEGLRRSYNTIKMNLTTNILRRKTNYAGSSVA